MAGKQYYVRDPESPFYDLMENTEVEKTLSEEEKQSIYDQAVASRVFTMLEGGEITEHEHNFGIYGVFNKLDTNFMLNAILKRGSGIDIDFYEIERKYSEYVSV